MRNNNTIIPVVLLSVIAILAFILLEVPFLRSKTDSSTETEKRLHRSERRSAAEQRPEEKLRRDERVKEGKGKSVLKWNWLKGIPVLELLANMPEGITVNDPKIKLSLKDAIDRLYRFFLKNGPDTGIIDFNWMKEQFLKNLLFSEFDGRYYEFIFNPPGYPWYKKYRIKVSGMDGNIFSVSYPAWVTIEYGDGENEAKTIEEAKEVLKRIAGITLEEGKEIALRFLYTNHPFFKEEEFNLIKCGVKIYNSGSKSCYYEYVWRRKEKLPGYYKVYPTEVALDLDPESGLIKSYHGGNLDYKAKYPPNITKEEAFKMAEEHLPPTFPRNFPKEWRIKKPDVSLVVVGNRLLWEVTFFYPPEVLEGYRPTYIARRIVTIDAYTGKILGETDTGSGKIDYVK